MAVPVPAVYGKVEASTRMILFSFDKRGDRAAADRLYEAALAAARREPLYLGYGVPDTLQGRFEMLALHLFALLNRLADDPGDDPALARLVTERFVEDMDGAYREMGMSDVVVPKRMKTLYRSFGGRVAAYRGGLAEGKAALADAVARNVFPAGGEDERAAGLAGYLVEAVAALRAADLGALRRGEVPFPTLGEGAEAPA